jgi:hypothetical protein
MRNLHLIPTDGISKIFYIAENFHLEKGQLIEPKSYHNIYITSDEEIKKGDWFYFPIEIIGNERGHKYVSNDWSKFSDILYSSYAKKIILTTDQDLIANGVQEIDDDFLEWFVKNPSCEYVETVKVPYHDGSGYSYLLGIPQEESNINKLSNCDLPNFSINRPIFDKLSSLKEEPRTGSLTECIKSVIDNQLETISELQEEFNHETLEEVSFRLYPRLINDPYNPMEDDNKEWREEFIKGAEWQAERMYSEKEAKKLAFDFYYDMSHKLGVPEYLITENSANVDVWFKQFKKK